VYGEIFMSAMSATIFEIQELLRESKLTHEQIAKKLDVSLSWVKDEADAMFGPANGEPDFDPVEYVYPGSDPQI